MAKAEGEKSDKSDKKAEEASDKAKEETNGAKKDEDTAAKPAQKPAGETPAEKPKPKYPPYAELLKDTQKMEGLFTVHRKDETLFAEIGPRQLDRDYIVLITIARGIGQTPIVGGFSWGFGDDAVWQFRKAGENIQLVRRNVRFTADKGSPTEKAVKVAYTDSVLFSLPIRTVSPGGGFVVDLTPVFMSDLPQIGFVLPGFSFSPNKSTWAEVDVLPKNVELGVAATYSSSGMSSIDSVPDTRGVTINVHYSISELPQTSYRPRFADDRVGYFVTALKDFSKKEGEDDRFVRYINRWNLEKTDPSADMSTPKEPIVFWLEKTIPFKYRKPIRDGIMEWNKAFAKAGFYDAVEVRHQTVAALAAAAHQRYDFSKNIRYLGYNVYEVKLFGNLTTQKVRFDGWTSDQDPRMTGGEFWQVLMQRARLQALGIDPTREYTPAEWDAWNTRTAGRLYSISDAILNFTGATASYKAISTANALTLQAALAHGDYLVAQSRQQRHGQFRGHHRQSRLRRDLSLQRRGRVEGPPL